MNSTKVKYLPINNRECFYCGVPESVRAIHEHHVFKRSLEPARKEDKTNKCPLCYLCHKRTEEDHNFYKYIQELWTTRQKHQEK